MKQYIPLILSIFFIFSCTGEGDDSNLAEKPLPSFDPMPKELIKSHQTVLNVFDFDGFEPYLNRKDGKVHVINFWATWCVPCVKELPFFEELNTNYPEITMTLVSLDFYQAIETSLIPFIQKEKLRSEVIMLHQPDADSWISKVDPSWSGALPATVIYKDDQTKFFERSFTYEELERELKPFLE